MLHRGSLPVPPCSGGLRCRGKLLGVSGATDMPPVPGCTLPEGSTGMSSCGRAPSVLADGPIAGSLSDVSCMPLKSVFPTFPCQSPRETYSVPLAIPTLPPHNSMTLLHSLIFYNWPTQCQWPFKLFSLSSIYKLLYLATTSFATFSHARRRLFAILCAVSGCSDDLGSPRLGYTHVSLKGTRSK